MADAQIAADLMLRDPKTLGGDASVADARAQLADPKVQMLLLADGPRFVGAVTEIPAGASDDDRAVAYADPSPETIDPNASADEAWERALASGHRRVIVLDDAGTLHGLLCLNHKRTGFCQTPTND
ncbi:MAG TPA: CBS domain-containing protein [Gaiellaceae bacterium]|nr:CBS domain-containing protein [Gaiellaceae bacterium]